MQVVAGRVCDRQAADPAGVKFLWNAGMQEHETGILLFKQRNSFEF
jgi:hypothetical protein